MERKFQPTNKRVFSGSGNTIVKTPIKNTGANRLEEENKRLKNELIRKERIIQDYQRRINSLNKTVNELRAKLNQSKSNHSRAPQRSSTNNNNHYHGSDFDEFTNNFFRNPELLFSDMFGQGQSYAPQFEDNVYQQEPSNLEEDIINQLYPNPDNMTYEQLLALEEQVGSVSKGLTKNEISKIPIVPFSKYNNKDCDKCAICQYEFKEKERVKKLRCGHLFHTNCVDTWLNDNKVCPICKKEAIYR